VKKERKGKERKGKERKRKEKKKRKKKKRKGKGREGKGRKTYHGFHLCTWDAFRSTFHLTNTFLLEIQSNRTHRHTLTL
jgi:hypothetical protein